MSDLVKRLKTRIFYDEHGFMLDEPEEAATRIEQLEAENARLREAQSRAALDVLVERVRQVTAEKRSHKYDDGWTESEIAVLAACYALTAAGWKKEAVKEIVPLQGQMTFKPTSPRRDLVKAGALIIAEIERLDRAALAGKAGT